MIRDAEPRGATRPARPSRARRRAVVALLVVALAYGSLLALTHLLYKKLLYPGSGRSDPARATDVTRLEGRAGDGVSFHALGLENPGARFTIVYFHGNGEVAGDNVPLARELVRRGFAVVLAEYRGYGASRPGRPDEPGLYADAEGVLGLLRERGVGPDRVVLWGMSLGTGIAAEMARRGRGAALVLVAPYTSIVRVASHHVPFLPVARLMDERFDTLGKAGELRLPTLIVHGTADEVVPFGMGEELSRAIPRATLVPVKGGHHNDLFARGGQETLDAIDRFVNEARPEAP